MFVEDVCWCRHDCCFKDDDYWDCFECDHHASYWNAERYGITWDDVFGVG